MHSNMKHAFICGCSAALIPVWAMAAGLPEELSGRWTWAERGLSQTFELEDIKAKGEDGFVAELTWWTLKSECAIRGVPIEGSYKDGVLSFSAETKCGSRFDASMKQVGDEWIGSATAGKVTVELKAD